MATAVAANTSRRRAWPTWHRCTRARARAGAGNTTSATAGAGTIRSTAGTRAGIERDAGHPGPRLMMEAEGLPRGGPFCMIGADMKKGLRSEALSHGRFEDQ